MCLLHKAFEILVYLGKDGFRWHEHEGRILGLALQKIFVGDIPDMGFNIAPELLGCQLLRIRPLGAANIVPCFQRKFCIDNQRGRIIGHIDKAIGPVAIGKRRLKGIGICRQTVGNDRLHAG